LWEFEDEDKREEEGFVGSAKEEALIEGGR
jgi:hypothetical protein